MLAEHPTPGAISLAFRREPSFFGAAEVDGRERQIFVGRDVENGTVIGTGSRSIMDRFVNGTPTPIGYLSGLRLAEPYRQRGLIARAFVQFRQFHQDEKTRLYLTTVAADNTHAIATLTSARAGLPRYHDAGAFHTAAIPIPRRSKRADAHHRFEIRPATADDIPRLIRFYHREGSRRQFFPCYESRDLFSDTGLLRGLLPADLLMAVSHDKIIGTLGLWNQHAFRQQVVTSYGQHLRFTRPLLNALASLRKLPKLPEPGQPLRPRFASLVVIAKDNPTVFRALLAAALRHAHDGVSDYLLVGLHNRDPLLPSLRQQRANWYTTNLYLVCWKDGEELRQSLDDRPPYLELGSL